MRAMAVEEYTKTYVSVIAEILDIIREVERNLSDMPVKVSFPVVYRLFHIYDRCVPFLPVLLLESPRQTGS